MSVITESDSDQSDEVDESYSISDDSSFQEIGKCFWINTFTAVTNKEIFQRGAIISIFRPLNLKV